MSDNPYIVVRKESHQVIYKDGWKRIQQIGWDSQGRVVLNCSDDYYFYGQNFKTDWQTQFDWMYKTMMELHKIVKPYYGDIRKIK